MPRPTRKRAATRAAAEASREKRRREDEVRRCVEAAIVSSGVEWSAEQSLLHAGFFEDPDEIYELAEDEREESQGEEEEGGNQDGSAEGENEEDEGEMEVRENVLEEMMQNKDIWEDVEKHQHFRYQRGATSSRQTEWRLRTHEQELVLAAASSATLDSWLTSGVARGGRTRSSSNPPQLNPQEMRGRAVDSAIQSLKRLLESKSKPIGQDYSRHLAVLHFLYLQRKRPSTSRRELSLAAANAFNRGRWVAEKIVTWERIWISEWQIPEGMQGKKTKIVSWLNDEGVQLAVREYMSGAGEGISALGLAKAITAYVEVIEAEKDFVDALEDDTGEEGRGGW